MNPIRSSEHSGGAKKAVEVIRYFRRLQGRRGHHGEILPYRLTASGAWAASRPAHLFNFFKRIDLSGFGLFIDLGSGDGVASCTAGLFTRSIGIESDPFLVSQASRAARDLKLEERVWFIRADFLTQGIREADCLYIYPDKPVYVLEEVLDGWAGTLLIYGPHFPPKRFRLRKKLRCGKETMSVYCDPAA
ncbi:MAG: hypothetical protein ABSE08_15950 [Syntrophobacteraceae bacterium]|jgi:hypothetical protein